MENKDYIVLYEFLVCMPNGDYMLVDVYDLPEHLAYKFVCDKYPEGKIDSYAKDVRFY